MDALQGGFVKRARPTAFRAILVLASVVVALSLSGCASGTRLEVSSEVAIDYAGAGPHRAEAIACANLALLGSLRDDDGSVSQLEARIDRAEQVSAPDGRYEVEGVTIAWAADKAQYSWTCTVVVDVETAELQATITSFDTKTSD